MQGDSDDYRGQIFTNREISSPAKAPHIIQSIPHTLLSCGDTARSRIGKEVGPLFAGSSLSAIQGIPFGRIRTFNGERGLYPRTKESFWRSVRREGAWSLGASTHPKPQHSEHQKEQVSWP